MPAVTPAPAPARCPKGPGTQESGVLPRPAPSPRRVGLVGYFGWGNFGDELMLQVWRNAFRDVAPAEPVHSLLRKPYFTERADAIARRHDSIVIGGGDLVVPDNMSSLYWNRAWLERPIVLAGIGVALEGERCRPDVVDRLRTFFSHEAVRSITVRDRGSAVWIEQQLTPAVPVHISADLAFAADLPPADERAPGRVGVVLRKTPSAGDRQTVERIHSWANRHGLSLELLCLAVGTTRDQELEGIRDVFGDRFPLRACHSVKEMCRAIGACAVLFTAKFHGAVIAARYGVPALSLRPTHKISALAEQLGDPGLLRNPLHLTDNQLWETAHRPVPAEPVRSAEVSARAAVRRAVEAATSV